MEDSHLSLDIIYEILSRITNLSTLARCKLVCKAFNDLVNDSTFSRLQAERTGIVRGYFFNGGYDKRRTKFVSGEGPPRIDKSIQLDFLPTLRGKVVACSNQGILVYSCCSDICDDALQFFVCKPCTKQWKALPNPKLRYPTLRVAIVVLNYSPLRFKILRLSRPKRKGWKMICLKERCEIFDSTSWRWREVKEISLLRWWDSDNTPAVVLFGTAHWIYDQKLVLGYNLEAENYAIFELPQEVMGGPSGHRYHMKLITFKGALALACRQEYWSMTLWVLTNYKDKIWEKKETSHFESTSELLQFAECSSFYNADIALLKAYSSLLFYNFQVNTFSEVCMETSVVDAEVFPFQSDLEPVSFKRSGCK